MKFRIFLNSLLLLALFGCAPAIQAPGTVLPVSGTFPTATATASSSELWIAPSVPDALRQAARAAGLSLTDTPEQTAIRLDVDTAMLASPASSRATWIYALVTPFPTVADGVSLNDLQQAWAGETPSIFGGRPLLMSADTYEAIKTVFGSEAAVEAVKIVPADGLVAALWQDRPQWGIVPFEQLDPKLKVLAIDGQSPIHKDFDAEKYALKVVFSVPLPVKLPAGNRDASKLLTVIMTGTSALTRAVAFKMEENGMTYPGLDIRDVLRQADILHVSSEVSLADTCPPPSYDTHDLRFCGRPEYLKLFEDVGVDIVEATGNHINNWDIGPFADTLKMYKARGWLYFGGGLNLADAETPALVERNGAKLAFLGCNLAGPEPAYATATLPGAAPCGDYDWILSKIGKLRSQGYQMIVTQQYNEYYQPTPTENQARDFARLAAAGATVVSGSQAHYPQTMAFLSGVFVHYGLGNLFFDQMSYQFPDTGQFTYKTRDGFLDRHVFYDGKYISVELLTAILEDHSRPRWMTAQERSDFLTEYFKDSGW